MGYAYAMYEHRDDALAAARSAGSAEGLHRALLAQPPSGQGHHAEAVEPFCRFHHADAAGAVDTVVLLCTRWCWRRSTAQLIAIVGTDVLDDDGLNALAARPFWPERPTFGNPLPWWGLHRMDIDFATGRIVADGTEHDRMVTRRLSSAPGPARWWASTRLLLRDKARLFAGLRRGDRLPAYPAESVVARALDVHEHLHLEAAA